MSVTISGDFTGHIRLMYEMSLQQIIGGNVYRRGVNGYTTHALHCYIISVAAVESYVNETLLSHYYRTFLKDSPLWKLPSDWLEKIELSKKIILVPQLLFGISLSPDKQPYQDMAMVIRVRNDLVHYKMKGKPPKYLKSLDDRKISLAADRDKKGDFPWPHKLSTTEGIRWAFNTACKTVHELHSLIADGDYKKFLDSSVASNFKIIDATYPRKWLKAKGIDPNSNHPEKTKK